MDLNPESGENLMEPDNEGWGWAQLLTSPGYTLVLLISNSGTSYFSLWYFLFLIADNFQTLQWTFSQVAGMLCGVLANMFSKHVAPVARIPRDLATRYNVNGSSSQVQQMTHRVVDGPAKMVLVVRTDLGMTKGKAARASNALVSKMKVSYKLHPA